MKTINRVLMLSTYRGLSQKAVAAAMQISQARYSKLERNPQNARLGTLERLAQALGTSVSFFTDDTLDFKVLAKYYYLILSSHSRRSFLLFKKE